MLWLPLNLINSSLKSIFLQEMHLDTMMLEANILENLTVMESNFQKLKLVQGSVGRLLSLGIDNVDLDLYLDPGNNTHCLELEELERRESCFHVWAAIDIVIHIVCSLRICSQITLKVAAYTNRITSCPCKCLQSVAKKLSSKSNFSTYVLLQVLQNNPNLLHGTLSLSTQTDNCGGTCISAKSHGC